MTVPTRKRGPAPRISHQAVLDVARSLPKDNVTMTAISAELGVTVGALYRYFPDRTAVLDALAEESMALLEPPDDALGWREWLRAQAHLERALWLDHPELQGVQARSSLAQPAARIVETGLRVLQRDGFEHDDAIHALLAMGHLAYASAIFGRDWATVPDRHSGLHQRLVDANLAPEQETVFDELVSITLDGLEARRRRRGLRRR